MRGIYYYPFNIINRVISSTVERLKGQKQRSQHIDLDLDLRREEMRVRILHHPINLLPLETRMHAYAKIEFTLRLNLYYVRSES